MIDLYFAPTPNGLKVSIALEELGLDYKIRLVNIFAGEQFEPEFLKISPNNRIPAIVDHDPADGIKAPFSLFESGAILAYLAMKTGKLWFKSAQDQWEARAWLFWQMAGLGPMAGQAHHFLLYADQQIEYAQTRYVNETNRLYGVLDKRLEENGGWIVGKDYSVVDIACYPWIVSHERQNIKIEDHPNVLSWKNAIDKRPAVIKAYADADKIREDFVANNPEGQKIPNKK